VVAAPELVAVERAALESRDPAEAEDVLKRRYIDLRARVLDDSADFVFRSQAGAAGGLIVDVLDYHAAVAIDTEPIEALMVLDVRDGHIDVTADRANCRAGGGDVLAYPIGTPLALLIDRMAYRATQIPIEAVAGAARRLGTDAADLRFERMTPTSPTLARLWSATVDQLVRGFAGPQPAFAHPLLLAAAVDTVAETALAVFPNTAMTADAPAGPDRTTPAVVRRAVAFIDAHAGDPINAEDIARAAGVDVRSLRAGFSRHRGTTPTAYLRRVRLERAHHDLRAGAGDSAETGTVTTVAHRWGFASAAGFAAEYGRVYGRPPVAGAG
jgi:AraC-like DNA-binding protein